MTYFEGSERFGFFGKTTPTNTKPPMNIKKLVDAILGRKNDIVESPVKPVDITKLLPKQKDISAMVYNLKQGELVISQTEKAKKKKNLMEMLRRNISKGKLKAFDKSQIWYCYEMSRVGESTLEVSHLYTRQHLCTLQGVKFAGE